MLIDFKDENWEEKLKMKTVSMCSIFVQFGAPCQSLKPIMSKISDQYKDKANFYYADIEEGALNHG